MPCASCLGCCPTRALIPTPWKTSSSSSPPTTTSAAPLGSSKNVFLYLILNKAQANLAMARRALQQMETGLSV